MIIVIVHSKSVKCHWQTIVSECRRIKGKLFKWQSKCRFYNGQFTRLTFLWWLFSSRALITSMHSEMAVISFSCQYNNIVNSMVFISSIVFEHNILEKPRCQAFPLTQRQIMVSHDFLKFITSALLLLDPIRQKIEQIVTPLHKEGGGVRDLALIPDLALTLQAALKGGSCHPSTKFT